jgi:ABC-type antimicrobial peptide transport system permease subunit
MQFGSLQNVLNADRSFPAEHVAVATIENPGRFADPLRGITFQRTLTDKLRKKPGVQAIGWATIPPLVAATREEFRIEAGAAGVIDTVQLDFNVVSTGYFEAMGLQLVEGRPFDGRDQFLTDPVVVVDELLARRYFGAVAAKQHLLNLAGERFEIVGVVRGRRFRTLQESARPTVYFPVTQRYIPLGNLFVVMRGDATSLVTELPDLIRRIDNDAAVVRVARLDKHLSDSLVIDRLATTLVGVCGVLALVMGMIGVYGVMNDTVQRRTREIGLRIALGAARRQVARLVLGEALYGSMGGLAAGTPLALAGGQIGGKFVSGVPQWTVRTLGAPPVVLMVIVLAAAILPLRKALAVSAASALRTE